MDKIEKPLVIAFFGLYRSKISSLLLGRLYHFCGVVFLWLLMWFSKLTILRFPWLQNSLLEMWAHLSQNIALLGKAKWMKIIASWLEMQLLESFLMFFYTVPEKKSAVLELFGCYHLQCIVAITEPFSKCFLKYRFAVDLEVQICIFSPLSYICLCRTLAKYYGLLTTECILNFKGDHIHYSATV